MFFGATSPSSRYGFDELWTPLAAPSEGRNPATQDQPGVGFAAPRRLAFNVVLRTDFAAWALHSASLAER